MGGDFYNRDDDPMDDNGHGTLVAGIAAAKTNNGVGIAGVAWNPQIVAIKVMNQDGLATSTSSADGIVSAWADEGAKVINASYSYSTFSQLEADAVSLVQTYNVLVVAATLNGDFGGQCPMGYPAAYPGVVSVAATWNDDNYLYGCDLPNGVTLSAPGSNVLTTNTGYVGNPTACPIVVLYCTVSGTSYAAPAVAGTAAILFNCGLSAGIIRDRLITYSDDIGVPGRDPLHGYGRLNTFNTVKNSC
jgi:subtilisin family serine protease